MMNSLQIRCSIQLEDSVRELAYSLPISRTLFALFSGSIELTSLHLWLSLTIPSLTITALVNSLAPAVAVKQMETVTSPLASGSQAAGGRILTLFLFAEFVQFFPLVLCWLSFQSFLIDPSVIKLKYNKFCRFCS